MKKPIRGYIKKKIEPAQPTMTEHIGSIATLVTELETIKNTFAETADAKVEAIDMAIDRANDMVETAEQAISSMKDEAIEAIKEIKQGDPGADADEETIVARVLAQIRQPQDGKSIDAESVIQELMLRIPKMPDEKTLIGNLMKKIPQSKADLKIIQQDIEVDPMSVIEKIMALPEDKLRKFRLRSGNIDGLDQTISAFRNQLARGYLHGGGGGGNGAGKWTPQGITTANLPGTGIPAGTDLGTVPVDIGATLNQFFYPPNKPMVSLATNPAGGLRETGNAITSVDLTPTTTPGSLPLTSLAITGTDGFSYMYPSPMPGGGVEATQTDNTGFSTNNSYTATVSDGTYSASDTVAFNFAPVYYYGSAVQGLDISTDGGGLTKLLVGNSPTIAFVYNCTFPDVYYMAYDAAYPALTSIKDNSGFETINVWTVNTVSVTNSFGQVISYRKYEFKNPNTTSDFTNTFRQ